LYSARKASNRFCPAPAARVASTDPEREAKAADVIGLYLRSPEHAVVLCVDEKTAIQASGGAALCV
jgi:hypothetical protein